MQRNCKLTTDQISRLSIQDLMSVAKELKKRDNTPAISVQEIAQLQAAKVKREAEINEAADGAEGFGKTPGAGTGDDQQSQSLQVNEVKAGDKKITGLAFLLPGQKKTVQVIFPTVQSSTQDLQFDQSSAESGDTSMGRFVPFELNVPTGLELKEGDKLLFNLQDNPRPPNAGKIKNIEVTVKPADKGNGRAPGGGAGEKPGKPHVPGEKPGKPHVPGEKPGKPHVPGEKPGTGGGSSSFGSS